MWLLPSSIERHRAVVLKNSSRCYLRCSMSMQVPPSAQVRQDIPSCEFYRTNVDLRRVQTVVSCVRRVASLERLIS